MMKQIKYNENLLFVHEKTIEFNYDILELKNDDCFIFVILKISTNSPICEEELNNVFAIDYNGRIQWKIKNTAPSKKEFKRLPMVGIDIKDNGNVFVTDFMGRKFHVNVENGEMYNMSIVK